MGVLRLASQDHVHTAVLVLERLLYLNGVVFLKFGNELNKNGMGDVGVSLLAATQDHFSLDLISLFEELFSLGYADIKVAYANTWGKTDAFNFDFFRLSALFTGFLLFLVFKLTVVAKLTYRRNSFWRHLDNVETPLGSQSYSGLFGHNAERYTFFIDQPNFSRKNTRIGVIFGS